MKKISLTVMLVAIAVSAYWLYSPATVSISISSPSQSLKRGEEIAITWQSAHVPEGGSVYLQLVPDEGKGDSESIIMDGLPAKGSQLWRVPKASDSAQLGGDYKLHGSDIISNKPYQIRAALYIPSKAQCYEGCPPSLGTQLQHSDSYSFTVQD